MKANDNPSRVAEDSRYIRSLIRLIPAKFYGATDETAAQNYVAPGGKKNKKKSVAEKARKVKPGKPKARGKTAPPKAPKAEKGKAGKPQGTPQAGGKTAPPTNSSSVVYNKLDLAEKAQKVKPGKKKDLKKLLSKVEQRQSRLEKLKSTDNESAQQKEKTTTWNRAIKLAEGVKLKDDPKLLKRSIKKQESLKKQSKKKWTERVGMQKKKQQETQEKRQTNIKKRVQEKKVKKREKREKRR